MTNQNGIERPYWLINLEKNKGKFDNIVVFALAYTGSRWKRKIIEQRFKSPTVDPKFRVADGVDFFKDDVQRPDLFDPEVQKRLYAFVIPANAVKGEYSMWLALSHYTNKPSNCTPYMYRYKDPAAILAFGKHFQESPLYKIQESLNEVKEDQEWRNSLITTTSTAIAESESISKESSEAHERPLGFYTELLPTTSDEHGVGQENVVTVSMKWTTASGRLLDHLSETVTRRP